LAAAPCKLPAFSGWLQGVGDQVQQQPLLVRIHEAQEPAVPAMKFDAHLGMLPDLRQQVFVAAIIGAIHQHCCVTLCGVEGFSGPLVEPKMPAKGGTRCYAGNNPRIFFIFFRINLNGRP
jgi:hypothetical protein